MKSGLLYQHHREEARRVLRTMKEGMWVGCRRWEGEMERRKGRLGEEIVRKVNG